MPFIHTYKGAMKLLGEMDTGKCSGKCKTNWVRIFRYALKTHTNPLGLSTEERKTMTKKIKMVSKRRKTMIIKKTLKYKTRNSPPYPANEHCGKSIKGNDGLLYISQPNKNNICAWKKV